MASPNYGAYAPAITFVDGGPGVGTPYVASNVNGLRADLVTYIQNHINGLNQAGATGDQHSFADIDARNGLTPLSEVLAYANLASTTYSLDQRLSMILNVLLTHTGSSGTLTARLATLAGIAGGDLVTMATKLAAATTANTANTLASRSTTGDGVGGGGTNFAYSTIQPNAAGVTPLTVTLFTGSTADLVRWNGAAGALAHIDYQSNIITSAALQALSATLTNGLTAYGKTIVGSTGIPLLSIAGFEATATGSDMVLHVGSGWFVNSSGITVPYAGGTLTITATGSNTYVGVYLSDVGVLTAVANNATSAVPFPTSGAKPVYVLNVPANATQLVAASSAGAGQAFIAADLRFLAVSVAAGGGGSGAPTNAPYALFGTNGSLGSAVNLLTSGGAGAVNIHPAYVKVDQNSGPIGDATNNYIQPDIPARILLSGSGSGTTATVQAGNTSGGSVSTTPVTIALWGSAGLRTRTITANATTGTVPVAAHNPVYLVATLPSGSAGFTVAWASTAVPAEYSVVLGTYWYDGTTVWGANTSFKQLAAARSSQITPVQVIALNTGTDTAFASTGGYTKPANMGTTSFIVPETCQAMVISRVWGLTNLAAAPAFNVLIDGYAHIVNTQTSGTIDCAYAVNGISYPSGATGSIGMYWSRSEVDLVTLPAGEYTVTQTWRTNGLLTSDLQARSVRLILQST